MAETVPILRAQADVEILGLIVSLDRMEKGRVSEKSALAEISELYGFETEAIVTMADVTDYLTRIPVGGEYVISGQIRQALDDYYREYGAH